jgi:hypothetical protein
MIKKMPEQGSFWQNFVLILVMEQLRVKQCCSSKVCYLEHIRFSNFAVEKSKSIATFPKFIYKRNVHRQGSCSRSFTADRRCGESGADER